MHLSIVLFLTLLTPLQCRQLNAFKPLHTSVPIGLKALYFRGGNAEETDRVSVHVVSKFGSQFLDKKIKLDLSPDVTVAELKSIINKKFPGNPPVELQELYFGLNQLHDDRTLGSLLSSSVRTRSLVIQLDMISGTNIYNKPMSVSQAVEAYAALCTQEVYLNSKLSHLLHPSRIQATGDSEEATSIGEVDTESKKYMNIFSVFNQTMHSKYISDIASAIEAEKSAEVMDSTVNSKGSSGDAESIVASYSPLSAAFANFFNTNMDDVRSLMYYSALLLGYGYIGSHSLMSKKLFISSVPMLWLSRLRPVRFMFQFLRNFMLSLAHKYPLVTSILPAPLQSIAAERERWENNLGSEAMNEMFIDLTREWRWTKQLLKTIFNVVDPGRSQLTDYYDESIDDISDVEFQGSNDEVSSSPVVQNKLI